MAIVKMNKFTLLAFESKKDILLEKLQGFSEVEFINLQNEDYLEDHEELKELMKDSVDSKYARSEEDLSKVRFTLEFLKKYVPQKSGLKAMREGKRALTLEELKAEVENSAWEELYEKVKEKDIHLANLDNEKTKLEGEIDSLKPLEGLDVSFEELNSMNTPYFLGSVAKQYEDELVSRLSKGYIEIISRDNQDVYFLALANKEDKEEIEEVLRGFGFSAFKTERTETPIKVIHTNMDRIEKIEGEKFLIKEELSALDEEVKYLELAYEYYHNEYTRTLVNTNFLKTDKVSLIQGWIAYSDNDELTRIVKDTLGEDYYLSFAEVKDEEIDDVPIRLKNNDLNKSFENITEMYSLPRYNEIDPTPLLAPFFLIFFGMMVADAGYGLLILIGSLVALKVFNLDDSQKQFAKFFMYLSIPTIIFGFIYGSFFGDFINLDGVKLIDPSKDVNTILVASVVFGVIQIFFGLGIKAYVLIRDGRPLDALYDVGSWVLTLVSIGVFAMGSGSLATIGKYGMIVGMIAIVLTQGRHMKSVGGKLGQGLYALYGITGYVGDLVSYTRLMALGLAGGSIAGALNLIIGMFPTVALIILGPVIFILAHIFNLGLSLLGGYVHTCRLEYVEYFSKFYEGGGRPFEPFKTLDKFIKIKK
ncbi:V-type ATP synthase subunit I [Clostridium baratii]|uniref:V-type ATPase n=1 Tax=Clostridium baratii str. Sullivan TaxID=1415775 RepID=A0A0A7FZF1_9CLOT|nr:V-type ATP synthase subunit I [Clostridium baratii]AIY85009.1 V-type ATPase [Clostridium baratii str. Sullivan]MDU1052732.1 V-type ATP synthase subunit I [Clostridium baratii]MDU4910227.1 V-type ATP synthase subunit I [Clostridium baratii]CUP27205.1 V-type ATP synthase subunit I [Clostridium baratii]